MAEQEQERGASFSTTISPLENFTLAEFYHQKYYLQADRELMQEILARYPNKKDIVDSTAAARLNGYIAGYGDTKSLKKEIDLYGLTEAGIEYLLKRVE